jgi:aspartate racemase
MITQAALKKIGILGGMSPESTLEYYRILLELSRERLPKDEYPVIIIYSLNFREFARLMGSRDYDGAVELLARGMGALERAGADFALIASNTPHMFFEELAARAAIPLISIVEATLERAKELGLGKLGLLGTGFTMEGEFYRSVAQRHGLEIVVPADDGERGLVHRIIMEELVSSEVREESRAALVKVAQALKTEQGAEAIILGCTELPLILDEVILGIPVLDTTRIHAEAAFEYAKQNR